MGLLKGLAKFAPAALTLAAPFFPPLAAAGPLLQGAAKAAPAVLAAGANAAAGSGGGGQPPPAAGAPPPITSDPTLGVQGGAPDPEKFNYGSFLKKRSNAGQLGLLGGLAAPLIKRFIH
jgi:hypothetical protein